MPSEKPQKDRLDKLLVARGLCETRAQAQRLIMAGEVMVNDVVVDKPGTLYPETVAVRLKTPPRYVSRGGLKLEKALAEFKLDVTGRVCLDVGAATGGFTDCLLQHGAAYVHAVDVGYGQLDWRLRQDERVSVWEKTHILELDLAMLIPPPTLAVVDVSFISLKKVLPKVTQCLSSSNQGCLPEIIALLKPQFEYLDYCSPKGFKGVVTHLEDLRKVLSGVLQDLITLLPDWILHNLTESPIQGPKGNREFLVHLRYYSVEHSAEVAGSQFQLAERIERLLCNVS